MSSLSDQQRLEERVERLANRVELLTSALTLHIQSSQEKPAPEKLPEPEHYLTKAAREFCDGITSSNKAVMADVLENLGPLRSDALSAIRNRLRETRF